MSNSRYITHNETATQMLHEDPQFAAEYLNAVLEDGNQKELMLALRRIAEAFGGVSKLAEQVELLQVMVAEGGKNNCLGFFSLPDCGR